MDSSVIDSAGSDDDARTASSPSIAQSPSLEIEGRRWIVLSPMLWAAFFLAITEVALEFRAYRNGYSTLLFADRTSGHFDVPSRSEAVASEARTSPRFGPTASFPFRSRVIPSDKSPGVPRIWIMSASHADDARTPIDGNFCVLLERRLHECGQRCEVMNVSKVGHTISANTSDLLQLSETWKPDIVVLYQMSMDISSIAKRQAAFKREPVNSRAEIDAESQPLPTSQPTFAARFVESTTIYELLKSNVTSRISSHRPLSDGIGPEGVAAFEESVRDFADQARIRGIRPVLCTFAASHDGNSLSRMPDDSKLGTLRHTPSLSIAGWCDSIAALNTTLRRIGASEQLPVIDLQRDIDAREDLFRDFVHFNLKGHEAVGEAMCTALRPLMNAASTRDDRHQ